MEVSGTALDSGKGSESSGRVPRWNGCLQWGLPALRVAAGTGTQPGTAQLFTVPALAAQLVLGAQCHTGAWMEGRGEPAARCVSSRRRHPPACLLSQLCGDKSFPRTARPTTSGSVI